MKTKTKAIKAKAPSKSKAPKTKASDSSSAEAKPTRTRVGNVRGLILEFLQSGPLSSPALVARGGFSPASVFLNIRSLKQEGLVTAARNGREVLFSLTGSTAAPAAAPSKSKVKAKKSAPVKSAPAGKNVVLAYVPSELHAALNGLTHRLSAVEGLPEKLKVLDTLRASLPAPIAAVLASIAADLQRMSADAAAPVPF